MCARRSAAQLWTSRCRFWASELLILDLASAALCAHRLSPSVRRGRPLALSLSRGSRHGGHWVRARLQRDEREWEVPQHLYSYAACSQSADVLGGSLPTHSTVSRHRCGPLSCVPAPCPTLSLCCWSLPLNEVVLARTLPPGHSRPHPPRGRRAIPAASSSSVTSQRWPVTPQWHVEFLRRRPPNDIDVGTDTLSWLDTKSTEDRYVLLVYGLSGGEAAHYLAVRPATIHQNVCRTQPLVQRKRQGDNYA